MLWYLYTLWNDHYDKSSYRLSSQLRNYLFLWWKRFKIYSLSNFQIHNTVLFAIVSMLYMTSLWLIYFITGSLYLLASFTHFAHPSHPLSGNHQSVSMSLAFLFVCFVLDSTYKWNHAVFQGPSMLLQMARFHSFLWLNNIPLCVCVCVCVCVCITSSLSIHSLMGT